MSEGKTVIKCLAIGFACFIIFSIVSAALMGFAFLGNILGFSNNNTVNLYEVKLDNLDMIKNLKIDLSASNIKIVKSSTFKFETNNERIKAKVKGSSLEIKDTGFNLFSFTIGEEKRSDIILSIPENFAFSDIDLDLGAGKAEIESLITDNMDLDAGAGSLVIDYLDIKSKADFSGGVGKMVINNGILNNLDFDIGVGKTDISAKIFGKSDIDAGVGEVNINLLDSIDNYKISLEKGLGSIKVNGENVSNDSVMGNGDNYIAIEAGVGALNITTK